MEWGVTEEVLSSSWCKKTIYQRRKAKSSPSGRRGAKFGWLLFKTSIELSEDEVTAFPRRFLERIVGID